MAQIKTVDPVEFSQSEPEPTRPTWKTAFGLAAVLGIAYVAAHWHEILASANFS